MKTRDPVAAIAVDHRRQTASTVPPAPSKGDEQSRKKKASTAPAKTKQPQQQQTTTKSSMFAAGSTSGSSMQSTKKGVTSAPPATAATPIKKPSTKQSKAAKKKSAAAAANATAVVTVAAPIAVSTAAATSQASVSKQQVPQRTLDSDSVKSRNHTLFLAPSGSSLPSWGHSRKDSTAHSVTQRLHTEIIEYAQYTRSTVEAMVVHIEVMITHVRACVQSLWPRSTVETFGSYSTGIWLPSSDVDLVILDVVEANDTAAVTVKNLRRLAKALEAQSWVHSLLLLDTAKIPVLKLVSADTRVPIDITFESSTTHSGLIARDLIKRYADELPELYPLAVVFKQLLRERDLNDAYTGGLSSYSIVLMIVHFAQLWRNGERCFHAAAVFASGSVPPAPAVLAAEAQAANARAAAAAKGASGGTPKEVGSPVKLPLTPTSSYAAIVSRPKSLKRAAVSETGGAKAMSSDGNASASSSTGAADSSPPQRFSYAAVAAGIVKVSTDDEARAKASAPPSSYAAAVAAAASSKSSSAVLRASSSTSVSKASGSTASSSSVTGANSDAQLDSVSVTSSSADTEDSCSSASSSAADSDDESVRRRQQQAQQQQCVCLGEHTMMLLEFFGIIFDYRKNGISIRDGGYIYRLAEHGSELLGKPALVIEDPIHPDRNVSASSFAFSKVVAVFEDSYYALKYHRPSKFAPSALSCLLSSSGHSSHSVKGGGAR